MNIVLIGAGNVATQLGTALQEKGFPIVQVYSHTLASAKSLGSQLQVDYTNQIKAIRTDADIYFFAVKDSVLPEILKSLPALSGLLVHTAGSIPMDVFAGYSGRYGVLYPLQTFSKSRKISLDTVPLFIEANHPADENLLEEIALSLSNRVIRLTSEKRKHLHLAAVFACNFTNHLYATAAQILEEQDLPWDVLLPLIEETAAKVKDLHPKEAQTGPAVRYDKNVIDKHLAMLKNDPGQQEIYRMLSQSIRN
ncbi:MAG: DUF2520 domain-containing protein [Candidatus Symbiothrix sp.]|jgi:predicted short-subunit dehydrogenase-like oxidoreductase (DUF2520 family)|nr:DUF2520 domain-containing protein [Candidatus Symbiothrix sp.]